MNRRRLIQIAVLVLLAAAVVGLYLSPVRDQLTRENVRAFVEHLRGLWYGPAIFIGTFMLACVFALPASVFVIAAGFIWGWALGSVYSLIGSMLGAMASFYLGRFIGDGLLEKFGRVGRAIAKQVDHASFGSLLALRFIPGIPFAALNYAAGVAGVTARDFFGSTFLGVIPSILVFTYCADSLFNGSMTEGDALKRLVIVCALMLTIILLPKAVKRFTGRTAPLS
ncbi:MAG TPA: VTT domain-containing protein [Thermoanaerobaculia bacterium]|nr:VTT domain-containing protein [Thermoanaerobaculia bacterium]